MTAFWVKLITYMICCVGSVFVMEHWYSTYICRVTEDDEEFTGIVLFCVLIGWILFPVWVIFSTIAKIIHYFKHDYRCIFKRK